MASRIDGDVVHTGKITAGGGIFIPSGNGTPYDANQQKYQKVYGQEASATAADEVKPVHIVVGATGTILGFRAGAVTVNVGDSVVDVDLLKDGASVLSAAVQLDSGDTNYVNKPGIISSASVVVGDLLSVEIDATIGTGTLALGVFASVEIKEDPT